MSTFNTPAETGPKKKVTTQPIHANTHRWVAIFEKKETLEETLHELNQAGFDQHELSLLMQPTVKETWQEVSSVSATPMPLAAPVFGAPIEAQVQNAEAAPAKFKQHGAALVEDAKTLEASLADNIEVDIKSADALTSNTLAGAIMGMIAGAAATLIPGVGPVLGVGAIASGLSALATGAAVGSVAGGLMGYLNDKGLPQEHAEIYTQALKEGKMLLFVEAHYEENEMERNRLAAAQRILKAHRPQALFQEK